ncbi:NADH:flavin oxidoreductase / NADH oxidase family protein [Paenibacillus sp. yr247]|uniref:oxidoreductase n=1 Tax=Paenibacillus sp. yr247 TaxID=1761880 RepID=UPI000882F06B|nr:NADH:flavin oxidoreductase / NADH oxidase family protein [Paenibacillus sp. yr247]
MFTPGIYTDAHIAGWKKVADRVHQAGGYLFIQLMHAGRMSHPENTPHHRQPVAPSAIAPKAQMFTATGMQDIPVPRELSLEDVKATVEDFRKAAAAAIQAGGDGVEIHGANGYLIHPFISENANVRADQYGGSIENRARFAIEVATAGAEEIGAERTGIRVSPGVPLGDLVEGDKGPEVYKYLVSELAKLTSLIFMSCMAAMKRRFVKFARLGRLCLSLIVRAALWRNSTETLIQDLQISHL